MRGTKSKKLSERWLHPRRTIAAAQICLLVLVGLASLILFGSALFGPFPQWTVWFVVIGYGSLGIVIGIGVIFWVIKKLGRRPRREKIKTQR